MVRIGAETISFACLGVPLREAEILKRLSVPGSRLRGTASPGLDRSSLPPTNGRRPVGRVKTLILNLEAVPIRVQLVLDQLAPQL